MCSLSCKETKKRGKFTVSDFPAVVELLCCRVFVEQPGDGLQVPWIEEEKEEQEALKSVCTQK